MERFNEAACKTCGKPFRWRGQMTDCPGCPYCGGRIDLELLRAEEAIALALDAEHERLRERVRRYPSKSPRKAQRLAAGLLPGEAAIALGIEYEALEAIESGRALPLQATAVRMAELYGLDGAGWPLRKHRLTQ
jgi:hypothetical protein